MASAFSDDLMRAVRARFAHVESCPFEGERVFFENAGGALTLQSVVEASARFAAIPDNQGRANGGSRALSETIATAKADMAVMMNALEGGQFFMGESGTELLFRLIMNACLAKAGRAGRVLGSTLEHPASRSAAERWAKVAGLRHELVPHDDASGTVTAEAYAEALGEDTKVATIVHTSPVTGMSVDVEQIARAIRAKAPECLIIVDGIQHAAHGAIDLAAYDVDGYVISPYKMFSRHGYGLAWISPRLEAVEHDALIGGPETNWEMGTRDTGAYATLSEVCRYLEWLGGEVSGAEDRREKIKAAGAAIHAQEKALTDAMIFGVGNLAGLADLEGVGILGGAENPAREGLVSLTVAGMAAEDVVARLNAAGIRTHLRRPDHYSGNILEPLGLEGCVRVSMCHYNSLAEVAAFLDAMRQIVKG